MSTTPQTKPTSDDLEREKQYAKIAATTPPPATYKGRSRGSTKDSSWRTNIALWETYPGLPVAPLAAGNKAGTDAWLRIEAVVVQTMFAEQPGNLSPSWDPGKPTWPLPTPPASWSAGSKYAARRPWKKQVPQTRNHTGIDLKAAPGTPVLAPFSGTIVARNSGWEFNKSTGKGVKALIMQTDNGLTILLGGIRPDSAIVADGQKVQAGEKLAEIGSYPLGDSMLHMSIYQGSLSEKEVNARKSWPYGQPPPANLIDPSSFLGQAANNPKYKTAGFVQQPDGPGLVENDVEGGEFFEGVEDEVPFVSASDGRTGAKPCVGKVCVKADAIAWYNALKSYYGAASPLYTYASKMPNPTPQVIAAGQTLKDAATALAEENYPSSPEEAQLVYWPNTTSEYLNLTYAVREAIDVLTAFVASASAPGNEQAPDAPKNPGPLPPNLPPVPAPSGGGGGLGMVAGIGAAVLMVGVIFAMATSKSRRTRAMLPILLILAPGCGPIPPSLGSTSTSGGQTTDGHEVSDVGGPDPTTTTQATSTSGSGSSGSTSSGGPGSSSSSTGASTGVDEPPGGCECRSDSDCSGGAFCGAFGICVVACDPSCPVACQLADPGFCPPPCSDPCPFICSDSGTCALCQLPLDHGGGATASAPTGG